MFPLQSQVKRSLVLIGQLDARCDDINLNLHNKLRVLQANDGEADRNDLIRDISRLANDSRVLRLTTVSEAKYMNESVNGYYNQIENELDQLARLRDEINSRNRQNRFKGVKKRVGHRWTAYRRKAKEGDDEGAVEETQERPVKLKDNASPPKPTYKLPRTSSHKKKKQEPTYCLCNDVYYGEMVACDNPKCRIEWYHLACVNLKKPPKGKWYCPNCR